LFKPGVGNYFRDLKIQDVFYTSPGMGDLLIRPLTHTRRVDPNHDVVVVVKEISPVLPIIVVN